ncbi:MAG: cbb3-type cytochrome c oxidase subunit 3 [Acetobacteraceae bacterium]|nr:cbb3-type cytochrome c oxidase subunit 3 [Acetobacteraceae bacterium]
MPDVIMVMRVALLVGLVAASVALLVWLFRPGSRRSMDEAALAPWRDEPPPSPGDAPRRERRP